MSHPIFIHPEAFYDIRGQAPEIAEPRDGDVADGEAVLLGGVDFIIMKRLRAIGEVQRIEFWDVMGKPAVLLDPIKVTKDAPRPRGAQWKRERSTRGRR